LSLSDLSKSLQSRLEKKLYLNPDLFFFMSDKSESVRMVNDLLELTRSILQECDKDPDLNDLAIKYLLNQKQLLEKLRDIL
jgi:hypothetical protein